MITEHEIIVLVKDIPEKGLVEGDVGTVVHVYSNEKAYEVEFVTAEGETIAVLTLEENDIRSIKNKEILHVRSLI